jgi:ribose transport system substrate-binding protein
VAALCLGLLLKDCLTTRHVPRRALDARPWKAESNQSGTSPLLSTLLLRDHLVRSLTLCCLLLAPLGWLGCADSSSTTSGTPAGTTSGDDSGGGGASEGTASSTEGTAETESRGTIGVSLLTFENPFFKIIADSLEAEAKKHGYNVVALSADEDPAKQSQQISDFIVQGVVAIVLSPAETRSIAPAVRQANERGIPVFTVDIPIEAGNGEVVSQIATDNFGGGRKAAEAMIEAIGSGKVAVLHYQQAQSCRLRVDGFLEVIAEHNAASDEKIEVVATLEGGGAKDQGRTAAGDALQSVPDLRGIFAINDPSALGAVAAVEEAGKTGQVIIVGFDGQLEAKRAIKAGKIYADPIQFPEQMGVKAVEAILAHLNGEEVPPEQLIPTELYRQADAQADPELK